MKIINLLKTHFLEIKEAFENGKIDEHRVYELEEKIQDTYSEVYEDKDLIQLERLDKQLKAFKREYDFYDPETELNSMFPNRQDKDFDEDQTSW